MSCVLNIKNASIGYESELIGNVNIKLDSGKLYCLVGENGTGKSTLLKSILQDVPFLKGTIDLMGEPLNSFTIKKLAQHLSVVYTGRVSNNLTVYELVSLGRQPYTGFLGKLTNSDIQIIEDAINQTGLQSLVLKKVDELSDGQFQKVMLARALVQDTPLLLLDEPTSFLDPNNKVLLLKLLQKVAKDSGKTVLYSSHDIDLAKKFADEFLLVSNSKIEQIAVNNPNLELSLKEVFQLSV